MCRQKQARALWLAPLAFLGAVLLAAGIVLSGPTALFGWALLALCVVPVVWVIVSALWPARAERTCPACRGARLSRIDRHATHGLACPDCGWRDESASAWLLAEEEGPLEDIVLAQRGRTRRSPVDSSPDRG